MVLQQQKLLQQQQAAFIVANAAAGIVSEASGGRSSAPLNAVDSPTSTGAGKLGFQPVHSSSPTTSESRHPLKKRLLEAANKEIEIVDVVSVNEPQTSAKMPKMVGGWLKNAPQLFSFQNISPNTRPTLFNFPGSWLYVKNDSSRLLLTFVALPREHKHSLF